MFLTDRSTFCMIRVVARSKEFDPDEALERAIACFRKHGYEATSIQVLSGSMKLGRASMYATFGDKHALFEAALSRYASGVIAHIVSRLEQARHPVREIRAVLRDAATAAATDAERRGCLVTNSAAELGGHDPGVTKVLRRVFKQIEDGFYRALRRAQDLGQLKANKNPRALARFLVSTIQGIRVIGRTNTNPAALNDIVKSALRCLGSP